jgi:tetratricopeptide (TPR) repeat protein
VRPRIIAALVCAAILGLSTATTAPAADALLDQASALLREGKPKEAFSLLDPREGERAGDIDYDYLLGVSAVDAGSPERAVVAFERVLTLNPNHEGARLDLARAYYALGSDDLAKQEFDRVLEKNPPPAARAAISQYFEAMEKRKRAQTTQFNAYVEGFGGHDSNLTSSTREFTSAVLSSFNIAGVQPTGNSIKRSASFLGVAAGLDVLHKVSNDYSIYGGADVRRRNYNSTRSLTATPTTCAAACNTRRRNTSCAAVCRDSAISRRARRQRHQRSPTTASPEA